MNKQTPVIIALCAAIACFTLDSFSACGAADLTAENILSEMKGALEPEIASTRTLTFLIRDRGKITNTWVAREARKKLPDGKRSLLVMTYPVELKGMARLVWERYDNTDMQWLYFPPLKRVTKIAKISAYDSWQGTDYTYSDLGFINVKGSHKLLETAEREEKPVYKIETIPEDASYYSRVVTWVFKDNFLPLERELYDVTGELWKRQLFEQVTVINNIPTPLLMRMVNARMKTSTDIKVSEVCYGAGLPDEIFEPKGLSSALEYDFCPLPELKP